MTSMSWWVLATGIYIGNILCLGIVRFPLSNKCEYGEMVYYVMRGSSTCGQELVRM